MVRSHIVLFVPYRTFTKASKGCPGKHASPTARPYAVQPAGADFLLVDLAVCDLRARVPFGWVRDVEGPSQR